MLPWCHLRSPRSPRDLGCAITGAPGVGSAISKNREPEMVLRSTNASPAIQEWIRRVAHAAASQQPAAL